MGHEHIKELGCSLGQSSVWQRPVRLGEISRAVAVFFSQWGGIRAWRSPRASHRHEDDEGKKLSRVGLPSVGVEEEG